MIERGAHLVNGVSGNDARPNWHDCPAQLILKTLLRLRIVFSNRPARHVLEQSSNVALQSVNVLSGAIELRDQIVQYVSQLERIAESSIRRFFIPCIGRGG